MSVSHLFPQLQFSNDHLSYKTRFRSPRFQLHAGEEKPIQRSLAIVMVIDCAGVPLSEATEGIHRFLALRLLLLLLLLLRLASWLAS